MPQNRKGDISLHFSNNNLHIRCDSFEPSQAHSILYRGWSIKTKINEAINYF